MTELPDDAITAEAIDAFTVACAKASSVPGASAGDCYRAGLTAALPALTGAITAQATTGHHDLGCQCWPHYSQTDLDAARAGEREHIRQLAEHHNVRADMGTGRVSVPFADLLGGADGAHTPGGAT